MKPSTKNEINGNIHQIKGAVRETTGKITGNPALQAKGKAEINLGKAQKKVGQMEKTLEK